MCPEHIGEVFCDITKRVFEERKITPKSDPRNLMYKLIMNAFSFGKLNESSSFVYDPKTCMTITVNGQLMLCMLCEWIIEATKDTRIIQANTDGIALDIPDYEVDIVDGLARKWEDVTGLNLEDEIFDWLAVSNVNHYMGQYSMDGINEKPGSVKTKGQYLTKPTWTQDFSNMVIQKAVLEYFKSGTLPEHFIPEHKDPYDFRGRVKIDKRFDLYIFNDANREDPSFKKVGVSDCVNFQRIINSNDVPAILKELNNDEDFIHYIRTDISESKKIDYDDVPMKSVNSRLKSIPSRAKFLGEVFAGRVQVHDRIGKAFARWWLDRDKKLTMKPMKGKKLQTVTAYYMAKKGFYMFKETLPNEEQPLRGKFTGVQANQKVVPCNNIDDFNFDNIDFEWYINEAWKLITPIMPEKDKHVSPIYQAEQDKVRLAEEKIQAAIEKKALTAEKREIAAKKKLDKANGKK